MRSPIFSLLFAFFLVQPLFWGPSATQLLQWRPLNYTTQNGAWTCVSAVPDPGSTRRDDIVACGWNRNNEAMDKGGSALVFESHCGPAVGCPEPGQSETYFAMEDGFGHGVRPLGFFQSHGGNFMNVIARADEWGFFDAPQEKALLVIRANRDHAVYGTWSCALEGNCLQQQGVDMVRLDTGTVRVGGTGAPVALAGGDGSSPVKVLSNHFQLQNPVIENTAGTALLTLGNGVTGTCPGGYVITALDKGLITGASCQP